jgi:hypothetical protein
MGHGTWGKLCRLLGSGTRIAAVCSASQNATQTAPILISPGAGPGTPNAMFPSCYRVGGAHGVLTRTRNRRSPSRARMPRRSARCCKSARRRRSTPSSWAARRPSSPSAPSLSLPSLSFSPFPPRAAFLPCRAVAPRAGDALALVVCQRTSRRCASRQCSAKARLRAERERPTCIAASVGWT